MNEFDRAREKYKPANIKYLLVAETPPKKDSKRFFYFEHVPKQDSLFLETMKLLYPEQTSGVETKDIRRNKETFLRRFQSDGFFLIDALDEPFESKYSTKQKTRLVEAGQNQLLEKIHSLISDDTKVILIAAPVFYANYEFLLENGIQVLNTESIDFPGSGGQKKFREKMGRILNL